LVNRLLLSLPRRIDIVLNFFSFHTVAACFITFTLGSTAVGDESAAPAQSPKAASEASEARSVEPVSLEVWVISVSSPDLDPNNGKGNPLTTRLGDLRTTLGSRDDVRSLISQLGGENAIAKLEEFRVAALADREADVSVGWRKPKITATSITSMAITNAIVIEPLGTFIHITSHVNSDGSLRAKVKLEMSMLQMSNDVPISVSSKGESTFAQTASSFQLDTEVQIKNGGATLVSATPCHDISESGVRLVIVSAATDGKVAAPPTK
jgi:hypothetical protein